MNDDYFFLASRNVDIAGDTKVTVASGRNAGKYRHNEGTHGLALLRLAHIKEKLSVSDRTGSEVTLTCQVPNWWPDQVLNPDP